MSFDLKEIQKREKKKKKKEKKKKERKKERKWQCERSYFLANMADNCW
jgi:hypothetical protein